MDVGRLRQWEVEIMAPLKPSPLAQFLRAEMDRQGVTQVELERRTGIPDATLGRILKDEVEEVKGSQLNKIAVALNLPFWRLWTYAAITSEIPLDPSEEARQLAEIMEDDPELAETMKELVRFGPKNRQAVLAYIAVLRQQMKNDPQSAQESE
jgi:transcriptional regulator with XRE-family HTH domain